MLAQSVYTLVNQQNGNLSFKLFEFDNNSYFDHIQRNNYFTLILITSGEGIAKVDLCDYSFEEHTLFALYPYQPFMLIAKGVLRGVAIQFHHDFFCIYRHHKEIANNGVLFNNIYQQPFVYVNESCRATMFHFIEGILNELKADSFRKDEALVSYLKLLLVMATRIKLEQQTLQDADNNNSKQHFLIQNLKNAIEDNFRLKHSASDYADILNLTPVSLARITKNHFNKTPSDLITERIIIEAKGSYISRIKQLKKLPGNLVMKMNIISAGFVKVKLIYRRSFTAIPSGLTGAHPD